MASPISPSSSEHWGARAVFPEQKEESRGDELLVAVGEEEVHMETEVRVPGCRMGLEEP